MDRIWEQSKLLLIFSETKKSNTSAFALVGEENFLTWASGFFFCFLDHTFVYIPIVEKRKHVKWEFFFFFKKSLNYTTITIALYTKFREKIKKIKRELFERAPRLNKGKLK